MSKPANIEQEILQQNARKFLDRNLSPTILTRAFAEPTNLHAKLWPQIAELGWSALLVDESYGGLKTDFSTVAVLLEETGRACIPGPFFSSSILGALFVAELANEPQKRSILPLIATGDEILALAIQEGISEFDAPSIRMKAQTIGDEFILSGQKTQVPYADIATTLLFVARLSDFSNQGTEEFGVFTCSRANPAILSTAVQEISGPVSSNLEVANLTLSRNALLGGKAVPWETIESILLRASVLKSVEMIGGARHAMEVAVDYAKERKQFGQIIGSFQAIQHHCTDMLVFVETAQRMADEAVAMLDSGTLNSGRAAATKSWTNNAYREVMRRAQQIMGGMGYIDEHAMPWHFRHACATESTLGDSNSLLALVADDLYSRAANATEFPLAT